jgi:hypothetical protein
MKKEYHSQIFKEYQEIYSTKLDSLHLNKKAKLILNNLNQLKILQFRY